MAARSAQPPAPAAPAPPPRLRPDWHYHFLGIGGVGMSALAELLHGRGIRVSGSDTQDGEALRALAASGIPVTVGHAPGPLAEADAVVYSSAIREGHPIWAEVARLGLPRLHRADLLGALADGAHTLAVAGTHGKTTCTAALGLALVEAGWNPTVLVGGHVGQLGRRNYRQGALPWLVCEADESDGSFLRLSPRALLLTNVEADHLDYHGSLERLTGAFQALLERLGPAGTLVYCGDDPGAAALGRAFGGRALSYGTGEDVAVRVRVERLERGGMTLSLERDGGRVRLASPLIGRHNALNLAGVYALARALGLPEAALCAALETFRGVERRQQRVGEVAGLALYDDYAHHPTEVRETLAGFLATHGEPLTVVFQPHLYSRTLYFAAEFAEALRPATRIYVCEIYGAREAPMAGVSARLIVERLRDHPAATYLSHWREMVARVRGGEVPPGVLLSLGAGDITGLGPLLLGALS